MSSGVILLQKPYISFSSPFLLILRRAITAAAVALLYIKECLCILTNTKFFVYLKEIVPQRNRFHEHSSRILEYASDDRIHLRGGGGSMCTLTVYL